MAQEVKTSEDKVRASECLVLYDDDGNKIAQRKFNQRYSSHRLAMKIFDNYVDDEGLECDVCRITWSLAWKIRLLIFIGNCAKNDTTKPNTFAACESCLKKKLGESLKDYNSYHNEIIALKFPGYAPFDVIQLDWLRSEPREWNDLPDLAKIMFDNDENKYDQTWKDIDNIANERDGAPPVRYWDENNNELPSKKNNNKK